MAMRSVILGVLAMTALSACAGGGAKREVTAVVESETARQAAVDAARKGDTSEEALKKGADAAADPSKTEPPT